MFAYSASKPAGVAPRVALIYLAAALAPALAGCGSSQATTSAPSPSVMSWSQEQPSGFARQPGVPVDMEDDGIPAQTPPQKDIRNHKDDPTQPWSPNYGRVNTADLPSQVADAGHSDTETAVSLNSPDQQP